jgi:lambda family phage portal protein
MSLYNLASSAVDKFVSVISPETAIRRHANRAILSKLEKKGKDKKRQGYAAAKSSRLTGTWSPTDLNVNELIRGSAPQIRARIRQLVRDFPIFSRAVTVVIDHTIGTGLGFQSKAINAKGDLDNRTINIIEDAFKRWSDEADIAGKQNFYQMMRGAKRQELESGEFITVIRMIRDKSRYLPLCLQEIEADMLTDNPTIQVSSGNEIENGIEYEKKTGRAKWFHFTDPDSWGKSIRVAASDVIHGFDHLRPGQMHGVSPFVSGVLVAHDLGEYLDANIDTAKLAAKYLAFVKKDPATRAGTLDDGEDEDEGKKIDELENAIIEYLNPGESIEIAQHNLPSSNVPPTVKLIICMLSAATGVPYELLSFDYSGINYSSTRVIRNDFTQQLKQPIARHIRQYCKPIADKVIDSAFLHGGINLPGYISNPLRFRRYDWQLPGSEMIDWLKESKARISEMGVSLRSPQEIVGSRGRDFDTVLKETAQAVQKIKDAELDFLIPIIWKSTSTSVANNPAAVDKQNGNGKRGNIRINTSNYETEIMDMLQEVIDNVADLSGSN